jgi:hypothetical protein
MGFPLFFVVGVTVFTIIALLLIFPGIIPAYIFVIKMLCRFSKNKIK